VDAVGVISGLHLDDPIVDDEGVTVLRHIRALLLHLAVAPRGVVKVLYI
jgi:hypothetical protein